MNDREQRGTSGGSAGSFIGSMINPIANIKAQYFSAFALLPWGLGTYSNMARTGSAQYSAIWIPGISHNVKWGNSIMGKIGKGAFSTSEFLPGIHGGYKSIPEAMRTSLEAHKKSLIYSELGDLGTFTKSNYEDLLNKISPSVEFEKSLKGIWKEYKGKNATEFYTTGFEKIISKLNVNAAEATVLRSISANSVNVTFRTSQAIGRIGSVANWIGRGYFVGAAAMWALGSLFKGQMSLVKYAENTRQHARMINVGGYLSAGYTTSGAFTERQRLVQEMQRSPLAGRRMMGNEASLYHGML